MIKKCKYAVISFLFAAFFILAAMAAMNALLNGRIDRLLEAHGRIDAPSPVKEWTGWEDSDSGAESEKESDEKNGRTALTLAQVEDAVEFMYSSEATMLHDPVAGQISMVEAIESGKKWLSEMGICGSDDLYAITAQLLLRTREADSQPVQEPYYSYWQVSYSGSDAEAALTINAVSGKVWDAYINMKNKSLDMGTEDYLERFVDLAGLRCEAGVAAYGGSNEGFMSVQIKGSRLLAQSRHAAGPDTASASQYVDFQLMPPDAGNVWIMLENR